jgi:HD-GYP domain-containing protein (c-di-GMP phosphodiesterase class II)
MSEPLRFLTALGQALSAATLYRPGHPARERALDQAWSQYEALRLLDGNPTFSFIEEEILYGQRALRELKTWEWSRRLARVGIQRIEFDTEVTLDDLRNFVREAGQRVTQGDTGDTSEARQLRRSSIRYGLVNVRGASAELPVASAGTELTPYTLEDEITAITWLHEEVEQTGLLPMVEAESVVRSLSLAMHSQSRMMMPLLQLRNYDQYTTTHATNVAVLAMALSEFIGLGPNDVRDFGIAGLLHDLGKVRVPREILTYPGALSERELDILRRHPVDGARLILAREHRLELAATVAYEHHIMLNGGGYPALRYGRDPHFASKLVHVCDVYDALCTNRPYRDAWESEQAMAYLDERAGFDLDPDLVERFTDMMRQWTHQRVILAPVPAAT